MLPERINISIWLFRTSLIGGLVFFSSCADSRNAQSVDRYKTQTATQTVASADWIRHTIGKGISFRAPRQLQTKPVQGKDSHAGAYVDEAFHLAFDVGWYSDPLNHDSLPNFSAKQVTIDDRAARIVTFADKVGVHFAAIYENTSPPLKLTMVATPKRAGTKPLIIRLFKSIRFSANKTSNQKH